MMTLSTKLPTSTESRRRGVFSDQQIAEVALHDRRKIVDWILATAAEHQISARRLPSDVFARAVSRLSDGVVDLDPIEELLVTLARAGVLTSTQSSLLHANYLE